MIERFKIEQNKKFKNEERVLGVIKAFGYSSLEDVDKLRDNERKIIEIVENLDFKSNKITLEVSDLLNRLSFYIKIGVPDEKKIKIDIDKNYIDTDDYYGTKYKYGFEFYNKDKPNEAIPEYPNLEIRVSNHPKKLTSSTHDEDRLLSLIKNEERIYPADMFTSEYYEDKITTNFFDSFINIDLNKYTGKEISNIILRLIKKYNRQIDVLQAIYRDENLAD